MFQKTKMQKNPLYKILKYLSVLSLLVLIVAIIAIFGFVIMNGMKHISIDFLLGEHKSSNPSILGPIINTLVITVVGLLIALPIGVSTAVVLTEYSKKNSKMVKLVRVATETLAGIPSIIYAIFGMMFFVKFCGWGYSLKAGAFTLAIMILPTIIRATEESILDVPNELREGSYGIGAGKARTISKIVLPNASNGIISSIILSIGRIVSESAVLIFTAGTTFNLPLNGLDSAGATLAVAMYKLIEQGDIDLAYAAGFVLLISVIILNVLSVYFGEKFKNKKTHHS